MNTPTPFHQEDRELEQEEAEEQGKDESLGEETVVLQSLEDAWQTLGHVHDVHMNMFVSIMRIRFSWIIFFLIIAWLVSDLVLVYASALGKINVWELYALAGIGLGSGAGWILSSFKASQEVAEKLENSSGAEDMGKIIRQKIWCYNQHLKRYLGWGALWGGLLFVSYSCFLHSRYCCIHISDSVLIALVTTTTASVVGILAIVMHWLFPKDR